VLRGAGASTRPRTSTRSGTRTIGYGRTDLRDEHLDLPVPFVGAALALVLVAGFAPALTLALLWIVYLLLFNVSRLFLGYQ